MLTPLTLNYNISLLRAAMTAETQINTPSGTDDCPPATATAATGEVFRCAKHFPAQGSDLETHDEQGRLPQADPCLRRALSVFTSRRDAEHQTRLFRRWQRKYVIGARLSASHGKALATPAAQPSHTSWWPDAALDPTARAQLFSLVCEVVA